MSGHYVHTKKDFYMKVFSVSIINANVYLLYDLYDQALGQEPLPWGRLTLQRIKFGPVVFKKS